MLTPPAPKSPKRKNDEPQIRLRRLLPLAILLIAVGVGGLIWLRHSHARCDFPTARLAYTRSGDNSYIMTNLHTGERTEVELIYDSRQSPSPDGRWIAEWYDFNICCDSSLTVHGMNLGVYHGTSHSLSWTPDSQWIAFSAEPQRDDYYSHRGQDEGILILEEELYLQNVYTLEKKRLTDNDVTDRYPDVSPDGTQIAYTSNADGVNRIYIMDIATRESHVLTTDQDGYKPVWSPDGRWIAFISNAICQPDTSSSPLCEGGDLWLIRTDGTGAQSVVLGTGTVEAMWLP